MFLRKIPNLTKPKVAGQGFIKISDQNCPIVAPLNTKIMLPVKIILH